MSFKVYTGENCHDCHLVEDYINEHKLEVEVSNLDTEEVTPPIDIYARPALFKDGDLKAYGVDIIDYLKRNYK